MGLLHVCYVDFSGDLRTAECGIPISADELDAGKRVTLYMSSTTCPSCQRAIQQRLIQLASADSAASSSARILSGDIPAPRAQLTP